MNVDANDLDDSIIQKLLSAVNSGSTRKKQLLQSIKGVSDIDLDSYLKELIKYGLIGYDIYDDSELKITEKGLRFLISYERVVMSKAYHQPPKGLLDIR